MSISGNLLNLLEQDWDRSSGKGNRGPVPFVTSACLPKARRVVVSTTGPSHYAAIPLMSSMELRRKSEVQSRGFGQSSYSGPDARGIEAGNHGADSTGQASDGSHRPPCVSTEERDREIQAGYAGAATEASRKEKNPPAKFKLGHYPMIQRLASLVAFRRDGKALTIGRAVRAQRDLTQIVKALLKQPANVKAAKKTLELE